MAFEEQTVQERSNMRKDRIMLNMRQYVGSDANIVESIQKRAQTATATKVAAVKRTRRRNISEIKHIPSNDVS